VKWPRSVARCGVTVRSRHVEVPRRDREVVGEQDQSPNGELTTAVTTTQTTARTRSTLRGLVASQIEGGEGLHAPGGQGLAVIIVSEPSAETARRVRTDRSISARSPSSAAHNNTPTYTDAQPINVHTKEHKRI
jgi:hypothetical protein